MTNKRINVIFSEEQWKLINATAMGGSDAEKVKTIVISWLTDKSFITTSAKKKLNLE